jgi:putative ABC transport system ATP-binding protein
VLGKDLVGVNEKTLVEKRKNIGYIFQQHNLLRFLTAEQNVTKQVYIRIQKPAQLQDQPAIACIDLASLT